MSNLVKSPGNEVSQGDPSLSGAYEDVTHHQAKEIQKRSDQLKENLAAVWVFHQRGQHQAAWMHFRFVEQILNQIGPEQ